MIQKVSLFQSRRDFFLFTLASLLILTYTLLIEFQNYKQLTKFDSSIINATVISQYTKIKDSKPYQILKLKSSDGFTLYTKAKSTLKDINGKHIQAEIWAGKKTFYEYMTSFYAYTNILYIYNTPTLKQELNSFISDEHANQDISRIYQALYSATPLTSELYSTFSTLGVSHLLAISGFHLGVLGAVLFFLIKYPYKLLQDRYFPYRSYKVDSFIIISCVLLAYLLFLDSPASLLRAFAMLIIGFVLYDRGFKILSMQTLLLTALFLLVLFPRLFFALGFWLSIAGVFYIFLFLIHFKCLNMIWQFILVPFWVYLLMLPYSLAIFYSFSIYHPLSIIWTSLFTIFYPLSILFHLFGVGDLLDPLLENLIGLGSANVDVVLSYKLLALYIAVSFGAIYKKSIVWILLGLAMLIFIYSVYHVT